MNNKTYIKFIVKNKKSKTKEQIGGLMKKITKQNKGITLLALVVTIVILLILASVTIRMVTGQTNIFTRAKTGTTDYEVAEEKEDVKIVSSQISIDGAQNKTTTLEDFQKMIDDTFGENKATGSIEGNMYIIKINKTGNTYSIDYDGEVNSVTDVANIKKDETPGTLDGDGTESDPYLIDSIEDLVAIAYNVDTGTNDYSGKTLTLGKDLYFNGKNNSYSDMNSKYSFTVVNTNDFGYVPDNASSKTIKELVTTEEGFIPIGNNMGNVRSFKGNFDGKNHKINGLYIQCASRASAYAGLFGYVGNDDTEQTFKNLTLEDVNLDGKAMTGGLIAKAIGKNINLQNCNCNGNLSNAQNGGSSRGGIVGEANNITIDNCKNTGNIQAENDFCGGLIAVADTNATITNCTNTGTIIGTSYITMIAGILGKSDNTATIKNSVNSGEVRDSGKYAAGICANITKDGTIENCKNTAAISNSTSVIAGIAGNCGNTTINKCSNEGKITATNIASQEAGVAAICKQIFNSYNLADISATSVGPMGGVAASVGIQEINCYNYGNLSATTTGPSSGIGNAATSINCYNSGDVSANIGGGISFNSSATVTNCYNTGFIKMLYNAVGICGSGTIDKCYNSGNVNCLNGAAFGICSSTCTNSCNSGEITGANKFEVCPGAPASCYYLIRGTNAITGSATSQTQAQIDDLMAIDKFVATMNNYVNTNNSNESNTQLVQWKVVDGKAILDL